MGTSDTAEKAGTIRKVAGVCSGKIMDPAMKQIGLGACCIVMAACASQPTPAASEAACGGLPQPFTLPFVCPTPREQTRHLKINRHGNTCFDIEREPAAQGGLRIPRQIVCPPFKSSG